MSRPTLVIHVQIESKVRLLSKEPSVELHTLDKDGVMTDLSVISSNDGERELKVGTYVLVSTIHGVGVQILEGLASVIQSTGGEDPWPNPDPKSFKGGQDPFPVPGYMPQAVQEYVRKVSSVSAPPPAQQ